MQRLPRPSRWLLCSFSGNDQHLGDVRELRAKRKCPRLRCEAHRETNADVAAVIEIVALRSSRLTWRDELFPGEGASETAEGFYVAEALAPSSRLVI